MAKRGASSKGRSSKGTSYADSVSAPASTHGKRGPATRKGGGLGSSSSTGKRADNRVFPSVAPDYGVTRGRYPGVK